ncbi:MAG: ROK family protein [Bacteroidales bacterium]|nr:ROK family protein [Bacteroidales bacterium]
MAKEYVVGVDVGGQTTKIGVVNAKGDMLADATIIRSDTYGADAGAYIKALAAAIKESIAVSGKTPEDIIGIGVGAPNGNYYTGEVAFAPNLEWAANGSVPFAKMLEEALGCGLRVTLTNDANAAAVGEMTYGAAKGMKDFIMITLGTGVGSGIVVDGKVVYGHDGFAGELGHVNVVRGGRACGCGRKGCLEAYCSAVGIARTAREWLECTDEPSLLRLLDPEKLASKDIYDAAKRGDRMALRLFDYTGTLLGRSFADYIAFSAPQAIVLFGGLARAREFLYEPMLKAMNENVLNIWKDKVKIVFSSLPESDAAILGASALAWEL